MNCMDFICTELEYDITIAALSYNKNGSTDKDMIDCLRSEMKKYNFTLTL